MKKIDIKQQVMLTKLIGSGVSYCFEKDNSEIVVAGKIMSIECRKESLQFITNISIFKNNISFILPYESLEKFDAPNDGYMCIEDDSYFLFKDALVELEKRPGWTGRGCGKVEYKGRLVVLCKSK